MECIRWLPVIVLLAGPFGARAAEPQRAWPTSREGLVFLWPNGNRVQSPAYALDAAGAPLQAYAPVPRGTALLGRHYEMVLGQGSYLAERVSEHLVKQVNEAQAFTFTAWVTPAQTARRELGHIVCCTGTDGAVNFAVAQKAETLLGAVKTAGGPPAGPDGWIPLGPIAAGKGFHLAVTCGGNAIVAYRDGKETQRAALGDDLAAWQPGKLVFGDAPDEKSPWTGRLEGLAIYARSLGAAEIAADAAAWQGRVAARQPAPQVRIQGTLLQRSESEVDKLGAYFRALGLFEYKVDKVLAGTFADESIFVFHWTVMHRKLLPIASREVGKSYELVVEPFADHPELEPELQFDSLEWGFDKPVYYDVTGQP
jgi:hypothetical protein